MISKTNPLYVKADLLPKSIYKLTQKFPKDEMYGLTSQIRKSSLSVVLNIIEGFARNSPNEYRRFLLISFGSLEETRYSIEFAKHLNYIKEDELKEIINLIDEVAKIIWSIIK